MSQAALQPQQEDDREDEAARAVALALEAVEADNSLRFPKTPDESANAFAPWLEAQRARYLPLMREAVTKAFSSSALSSEETETLVEQRVWPAVKDWLWEMLLIVQAGNWVRRHFGDAITISRPVRIETGWRVPLGVLKYSEKVGQVVLDENGAVVPERTSTREEVLEKIRDRKLPAVATAAGQ